MKKIFLLAIATLMLINVINAQTYPSEVLNAPGGPSYRFNYKYWPKYKQIPEKEVNTIKPQDWKMTEHTIEDWDWSMPNFVEPSPRSSIALQRITNWDNEIMGFGDFQFKSNPTALLWVKWRDIEVTPGTYNFDPIIKRIKQANSVGTHVTLRILGHAKDNGNKTDGSNGQAPLWLEDMGVPLLPKSNPEHNRNFDPSHPEFHKRYLMLVDKLAKTDIPKNA